MARLMNESSLGYSERVQFRWPGWRLEQLESLMKHEDRGNYNFAARRIIEEVIETKLRERMSE